jgi:hypothetical protein
LKIRDRRMSGLDPNQKPPGDQEGKEAEADPPGGSPDRGPAPGEGSTGARRKERISERGTPYERPSTSRSARDNLAWANIRWETGQVEGAGTGVKAHRKGPDGEEVTVEAQFEGYGNTSSVPRNRRILTEEEARRRESSTSSSCRSASVSSGVSEQRLRNVGSILKTNRKPDNADLVDGIKALIELCRMSPEECLTEEQMTGNVYVNNERDWELHKVERALAKGASYGIMFLDVEGQWGNKKGTPQELRWLTIATFAGDVLHFGLRSWSDSGKIPYKECLPPALMQLLEGDLVVWAGVGLLKDFKDLQLKEPLHHYDVSYIYDGLIQRGVLAHWRDGSPRSGVMAMQLSLFGHEHITGPIRRGRKAMIRGKLKDNPDSWWERVGEEPEFWPDRWRNFRDVPHTWNQSNTYTFGEKDELTARQIWYNVGDLYTYMAVMLTQVLATLLVNPDYQGKTLSKELLETCLKGFKDHKMDHYKKGGSLSDNYHGGPIWQRLPGQTTPPSRYSEYLGLPKDQMPDYPKVKFGSPEYWKKLATIYGGGEEGGPSGSLDRGPALGLPTPTPRGRKKRRSGRRGQSEIDEACDWGGSRDDDPLAAFDDEEEIELDEQGNPVNEGIAQTSEGQEVFPDMNRPPQHPFLKFGRFLLGEEFTDMTLAERWEEVRRVQKAEGGARTSKKTANMTDRKRVMQIVNPVWHGRCLICGEKQHLSIDAVPCVPEEERICIYRHPYGNCKPGWQQPHVVKACKALGYGCKKCKIRGHHPDDCKGQDDDTREDERELYEEFAPHGYLTAKRLDNPYIGPIYMAPEVFTRTPVCPWTHDFLAHAPIAEVFQEIATFVEDEAVKNRAKQAAQGPPPGPGKAPRGRGGHRGGGGSSTGGVC